MRTTLHTQLLSSFTPFTLCIFSIPFVLTTIAHAETLNLATNKTFERASLVTSDVLQGQVEHNNSYCFEIFASNQSNSNLTTLGTPTVTSGTIANTVARGATSPWMGTGSSFANTRQCFTFSEDPTSDGNNGRANARSVITVAGSPANFTFSMQETTLYGGFNTVVTDFNFIEVTNTMTQTDQSSNISVTITANGNKAGSQVLNTTFELAPGQRFDVDVHSQASDDFGPVRLIHNGPKGAIKAVNAQYRIVSTTPTLDFEPVLVVPFTTRE